MVSPSNGPLGALDHEGDRRFRNRYLRWIAIHAVQLWLIVLVILSANAAASRLGMTAVNAKISAFAASAAVAFIFSVIARLQVHNWLARLYGRVRTRTQIAIERLGRDERDLMLDGVREVVFEWKHISDVLDLKNLAAAGLVLVTLFGQGLLYWSASFAVDINARFYESGTLNPLWIWGEFIGITTAHSISGVWLGYSVYQSVCFSDNGFDPTKVLQQRLDNLLTEVKDLRRIGTRSAST